MVSPHFPGTLTVSLKPTVTFVLNIKEKAVNGERHTYLLANLALRKQVCMDRRIYLAQKKFITRQMA
jgi:hypothetical protein